VRRRAGALRGDGDALLELLGQTNSRGRRRHRRLGECSTAVLRALRSRAADRDGESASHPTARRSFSAPTRPMFAPHHALRAAITPAGRGRGARHTHAAAERRAPTHVSMTWAQRLKRVFAIEIETCRRCGGVRRHGKPSRVLSKATRPLPEVTCGTRRARRVQTPIIDTLARATDRRRRMSPASSLTTSASCRIASAATEASTTSFVRVLPSNEPAVCAAGSSNETTSHP
jgi:hypothetical protein